MTVTTVLALATLGDATQIALFLFFVMPPKVAKASTSVLLLDLYIGLWCRCHVLLSPALLRQPLPI
jgi:hypothetical protein